MVLKASGRVGSDPEDELWVDWVSMNSLNLTWSCPYPGPFIRSRLLESRA